MMCSHCSVNNVGDADAYFQDHFDVELLGFPVRCHDEPSFLLQHALENVKVRLEFITFLHHNCR